MAASALLGAAFFGCAGGGSSASPHNAAGYAAACDDAALSSLRYGIELLPAQSTSYVRQEVLPPPWNECRTSVVLAPQITLKGVVIKPDGGTTASARVVATRASAIPGRGTVVFPTTTSSGGGFQLDLVQGDYQITVLPQADAAKSFPPLVVPLTVKAGMGPVVLRLARSLQLSGTVTTALQEGIVGLQVRALDLITGDLISSLATTTVAGAYTIWLIGETMPASIRLVADGGALPVTLSRDLVAADFPYPADHLLLRSPALPDLQQFTIPIKGRSTSGAMVAIQGALVDFQTVLPTDYVGGGATFSASVVSDGAGNATTMLLPGGDSNRNYRVRVTPPADSLFARVTYEVLVLKGGVLGTLLLDPRSSVVGQVTAAGGQPIGALVVAPAPSRASASSAMLAAQDGAVLPEAITAGDGRFLMRLEHGTYDFDLIPPAAFLLGRWSLDGKRVDGDLDLGMVQLPRSVHTTINVVGAAGEPVPGVTARLYTLTNDASCGVEGGLCPLARLRGEATADVDGRLSLFVAVP